MNFENIWEPLLLKGILFIIFGFIAIIWPGMALITLTIVFASLILLSGLANLIGGITGKSGTQEYRLLAIIAGIFEIGVGIYAFSNPGISIAALILLIGFTFIIRGIIEVASAFDSKFSSSYRALIAIGGIIGIIAGATVLRYPVTGGLAFIWVMGLYALVIGSIYVILYVMAKGVAGNITGSI